MKTRCIVILLIACMFIVSCASNKHYRGCDGKKKFKTQMDY